MYPYKEQRYLMVQWLRRASQEYECPVYSYGFKTRLSSTRGCKVLLSMSCLTQNSRTMERATENKVLSVNTNHLHVRTRKFNAFKQKWINTKVSKLHIISSITCCEKYILCIICIWWFRIKAINLSTNAEANELQETTMILSVLQHSTIDPNRYKAECNMYTELNCFKQKKAPIVQPEWRQENNNLLYKMMHQSKK